MGKLMKGRALQDVHKALAGGCAKLIDGLKVSRE